MLTQKQENFCNAYIETGNATESYRRAYEASAKWKEKSINRKAFDMLQNVNILTRLDELRKPAIKAAQVTLSGHLNKLAELRDKSEALGQMAAAISAETAIGKACGFYTDKHEITGKSGGPLMLDTPKFDLSKLSDEEVITLGELTAKARGGLPALA